MATFKEIKPRISAVVFDVDNVLVMSEHLHYESWCRVFAKHGLKDETKTGDLYPGIGIPDMDYLKMTFPSLKPKELVNIMHEKWDAYLDIIKEKIKPDSRTNAILDNLKLRYKLCAASSTNRDAVELVLTSTGILQKLEFMLGKEDVKKHKPEPDVYLLASKKLGLPPYKCVAVEDSLAGVESAKTAGMYCIAITTSFPRKRLETARADIVIDKFEELKQLL